MYRLVLSSFGAACPVKVASTVCAAMTSAFYDDINFLDRPSSLFQGWSANRQVSIYGDAPHNFVAFHLLFVHSEQSLFLPCFSWLSVLLWLLACSYPHILNNTRGSSALKKWWRHWLSLDWCFHRPTTMLRVFISHIHTVLLTADDSALSYFAKT